MGGVEQHIGSDLVGHGADVADRMGKEVEAAADGDELRPNLLGQVGQGLHIDAVTSPVDRCGVDLEAMEAGRTRLVVGDMTADGRIRHDDAVARPRGRHEGVEVGERPRTDADFHEPGLEHLRGECGGQDFDLFDRLQPHLVFVAGIAERRPGTEPARQHRLGSGVHDVGGGIEIDALPLVNFPVLGDQLPDPPVDRIGAGPRHGRGDLLNVVLAMGRDPSPPRQTGHGFSAACSDKRRGECPPGNGLAT